MKNLSMLALAFVLFACDKVTPQLESATCAELANEGVRRGDGDASHGLVVMEGIAVPVRLLAQVRGDTGTSLRERDLRIVGGDPTVAELRPVLGAQYEGPPHWILIGNKVGHTEVTLTVDGAEGSIIVPLDVAQYNPKGEVSSAAKM